ncbi:MAG: BatA domain-containing protein [Phycisphaerae bacterium]
MPFLNPIVFAIGAGAASLPIIIHLLNRRRFRIRDWAAMRFLMESLRKNRKRLRLEELLLLLIRTLIVLLLAVALGRFTGFTDVLMGLGGQETRTVVLVLDDSYSMGQAHTDVSLFDLAKQELTERIGQLDDSDRVAVILTSRPQEKLFFSAQQLTDPDSLIADLQAQELSDMRTSLGEALAAANSILAEEQGGRQLVVYTDVRRLDLDAAGQGAELESRFNELRDNKVSITVLDYGLDPQVNLTIEQLELADRLVVANREAEFEFVIRNNSANTAANVKVEFQSLRKGAGAVEIKPVVIDEIAPGASVTKTLKYTFLQPGSAVLTASLAVDDLPGDNVRHLSVQVQSAVKVLIVDGGSPSAGMYGMSVPLRLAMDPDENQMFGLDPSVRYYSELDTVDFSQYDLVILADVPDMPQQRDQQGEIVYPKLRELEEFVASGGGLLIFTGDRLSLAFYNGPMHANGLGLNPYKIASPVQPENYLRIDPASIQSHPGLDRIFGDGGELLTQLIRFFKYTPVNTASPRAEGAPEPRTLLALVDPKEDQPAGPLMVTQPYGDGTVVAYYSTANTAWNDWPTETGGTFVAVMQDMAMALARSRRAEFTDTLPASIRLEMPSSLGGQLEARLSRYEAAELEAVKAARRYDVLIGQLEQLVAEAPEDVQPAVADQAGRLKQEVLALGGSINPLQAQQLSEMGNSLANLVEKLPASQLRRKVLTALKQPPMDLMKHQVAWERIRQAGLYSLDIQASDSVRSRAGIPENLLIARNVDPQEGRIEPADTALIETVIGEVDSYQARVRDLDRGDIDNSAAGDADWWAWAMGALAALVLLETVLGLKFGHYSRAQSQG